MIERTGKPQAPRQSQSRVSPLGVASLSGVAVPGVLFAEPIPNPPAPPTQRFADVPPTNPFYAFIDQMALRGVTSGCSTTNYCPTSSVTRSAMAAFLVRGFGLTDPGSPGASYANAARFLEQATFGPTAAEIARVQSIGIRAYRLSNQH